MKLQDKISKVNEQIRQMERAAAEVDVQLMTLDYNPKHKIIEKLDCLEAQYSSGQLDEIHQTVKEIKEILLDPEDGIIVRVNKNTYWRKQINVQEIEELKSFKKNVTHALWEIYTIVLGVITKLIFWK